MQTNGSPDISNLLVDVAWDISGNSPLISLTNLSTGVNLAAVSYAFLISSPSQSVIHDGNIADPDITGIWSEFTFFSQNPDPTLSPPPTNYLVAPWPRPFGQIEWSGTPYSIQIFAMDSLGNVYNYIVEQDICRPAGNTNLSNTTFGRGNVTININCNSANGYFENISNTNYKGLAGTQESSVLKVLYPNDQTDTAPQPFIIQNFSNALVPITYDSDNYEFVYNAIYSYDFGNGSSIIIRYYTKSRFQVNCNIDLCPLVCEVQKLIAQSESGDCANLQEVNEKLILINGKLNIALIAKSQPLCSIDLPALIEEIKAIGGFDCNCCSPSGIQPFNSANVGDFNFSIRTGCGDITGYPEIVGNNVTFVLSDKSYIFKVCNDAPTTAFTVTPSIAGCTKTYCLNVNMSTLASELLSIIGSDIDLVNLFNSLITGSGGGGAATLLVDGKCIFGTSSTCDYVWDFTNVPPHASAVLTGIPVNNVLLPLNYSFSTNTIANFQAYLNTLGLGTFVITLVSNAVHITSTSNSHVLGAMLYRLASNNYTAKFTSDCTGFVPLSTNVVVQYIIDYLCGITDHQVSTSQDYEICYIDPATGSKEVLTVGAGKKENEFLSELLDKNCDTIDYILSLRELNCTNIKGVFPFLSQLMQPTDVLYGTKTGLCASIYPAELFALMLKSAYYNTELFNLFCGLNANCAGGFVCEPYTVYQLSVIEGSPANLMNIVVTFSHPSAVKNTIRYARVDNTTTPVYTTIPNVLPGASPYTISGINDGQYIVGITPIYADGRSCAEVPLNTGYPSGRINSFSSVFSGTNIIVSYNASGSIAKLRLNINYPNGSTGSTIYTNTGTDIVVTPPAGNYGTYTLTMTPVYNQDTGFYGETTAPSIINVTPPNNGSLVNNTTNALSPISLKMIGSDSTVIYPFNAAAIPVGGVIDFYVPSKDYESAILTYASGTIGQGVMVTYLESILGDNTPNTITFVIEANVTGNVTITLTDISPA